MDIFSYLHRILKNLSFTTFYVTKGLKIVLSVNRAHTIIA